MEADCVWCAAGKYQTGVGLVAEANCTLCDAGKYQSGSGLNAVLWLSLLTHQFIASMHTENILQVNVVWLSLLTHPFIAWINTEITL